MQDHQILRELALDLAWSWRHGGDKIWEKLDPVLWEKTHNAWVILQTVSREKLDRLMQDPSFVEIVDRFSQTRKEEAATRSWFQENYPNPPFNCVAYFSMEFMLSEALPIYSGGLGNVAGDQLKAANDLGVPVVGVSLLYQQGYFRQSINSMGEQQALYPYNDPGQLPISPLRKKDGEWLRFEIPLSGQKIVLRAWEVTVGRTKLYLLDSNDAANTPLQRGITSELYGGDRELRLKQELLLGIGGWHLLEILGIKPHVCHLNEGHAAFAILERAKSFMRENGVSFEVALNATRAGNHFTTHTAVAAGFDYFSPDLLEQYLGKYAQELLHISVEDLLALGRRDPRDSEEYFNMANLAIRGSGSINGVSLLHGKVSRALFQPLFPKFPEEEVPIESLTNGVHMRSWDSPMSDQLWTEACGKRRWHGEVEKLQEKIRAISDEKIWQMRTVTRGALITYANKRLQNQLIARGEVPVSPLDPHILTLGFARRFATYKRPNLLLSDPARFLAILTNPARPMQLLLAGKAHPADLPGQAMIKEWMHFILENPEARKHVIFLTDYDMLLTEQMVQGVDVWINTPRRPWEACGTSGMKVLVNGGINLSELDGWWAEAYTPEVGWAIGDGEEHGDDPAFDAKDAQALYERLENQIGPLFYQRDQNGMPREWIKRIRESMAVLTPQYSASRAVRDYTTRFYIPAAQSYQERAKNQGAIALEISKWKEELNKHWDQIAFGELKVQTKDEHHFEISVHLAGLSPKDVRVELFATAQEKIQMQPGSPGIYRASAPLRLPASAYTPRVLPHFSGVSVPLEADHVLWQK